MEYCRKLQSLLTVHPRLWIENAEERSYPESLFYTSWLRGYVLFRISDHLFSESEALAYGFAIMALSCGFALWPCHMAVPYGFAIWLSHMALPYGSAIWLCHMALLYPYGFATWFKNMKLRQKMSFRKLIFHFRGHIWGQFFILNRSRWVMEVRTLTFSWKIQTSSTSRPWISYFSRIFPDSHFLKAISWRSCRLWQKFIQLSGGLTCWMW